RTQVRQAEEGARLFRRAVDVDHDLHGASPGKTRESLRLSPLPAPACMRPLVRSRGPLHLKSMDATAVSANRLAGATSPYLLQHKDTPVHWQPWGPEAFARARAEGKPVLLSVGYAACHWCHVMAHESFENAAIADLMNELYVSIKVDREERP